MIKDTDRGLKALLRRLNEAQTTITVGVHGDASPEKDGTSVVDVATWNEFGTDRIPARSFLRAWFDSSAGLIADSLRKVGLGVVAGKYTAAIGMNRAAQLFAGLIQQRVAGGIGPANAASTVARKGSSKPLIDSGHLRSAIVGRVSS